MTRHSSAKVTQVVFLPDGRLASCSRDKAVRIWDPVVGQELFALNGHAGFVCSAVLLPNGWFATGSNDRTIKAWDLDEKREARTLEGHTASVVSLKVLKNGNLVSYSLDGAIKILNPYLINNNLLMTITAFVTSIFGTLSNDLLVACSHGANVKENILRVWNPNDGQLVKSLLTGLDATGTVLVLSNDQIAIGALNGTIKIVDSKDESKTRTLEKAHDIGITCILQLSNDNLVSAGRDEKRCFHFESIKVWSFADLSLLQHLKTYLADLINSMSVSKDETFLDQDKTIKLWPISSSYLNSG